MTEARSPAPQPLVTPDRWDILRPLIDEALDLPPQERPAYFDRTCAGDVALRAELARLVEECEQAAPFLERSAAEQFPLLCEELPQAVPPVLADRFEIEREVGHGGMATVYLARDRKHDRRVAVKVLRPELAASLGAERFLREIRTAARFQHPHILPVHDSGDSNGLLYYVMPYVEGESLRDRVARETQLPLDEALRITREVAGALAYAHSHDVVHRDIKPENILLSDGHALVSDFGIARAMSSASGDTLTQAGLAVGTPAYMSPEQAAAEDKVDGRTDVYALGCVLYELLSGHPPFLGSTPHEIIARHTLDPVPPLRTSRPNLPEHVERAVMTALAKSPADRFKTIDAFGEALAKPVDEPRRAKRPWVVALALSGVLVAALLYSLVWKRGTASSPAQTSSEAPSIAVLAFRNIGGDPNDVPLSDGISEEIATTLGKVKGLDVKGPRSAFSFKDKSLSLAEIGRSLRVRYLIDGSVRRSGRQLRITVRLLQAANDSALWTEDYRPTDADIFAVQDTIARTVSDRLRVRFTGAERTSIARPPTDSPEAHWLYQQGRYFFEKRDSASLAKAQVYFEQAIAKDSTYALAYTGVSDAYMHRSTFGYVRPETGYPEAKRYAERALDLDSTLAETHSTLAFGATFYYWDWPTAGREFAKALRLGPNLPAAHLWHSWYLMAVDSVPAAIAEGREAVRLDPFSSVVNTRLITLLFYGGRYNEALDQANHAFELDSNFFQIRTERARVYVWLGRCEDALADLPHSRPQSAPNLLGIRGYAYARCGRRAEALSELAQLRAEARAGKYMSHYGFAVIQAGLGNTDEALRELEQACEDHDPWMFMLEQEPVFRDLRRDPRFVLLVKRVGLQP